jgi:hypothetical protein
MECLMPLSLWFPKMQLFSQCMHQKENIECRILKFEKDRDTLLLLNS